MSQRFTFREAMDFIAREQRREFWRADAPQISLVILLALGVGFVSGIIFAIAWWSPQ
jgi:fatty acid desaturase